MTRPTIPILAFLVLLLLAIPYPFDATTSVEPGWRTIIYPLYFIWLLAFAISLLFIIIGYWLLSKRVDKINCTLFIFHFVLTVPTLKFMKFPSIFLNFGLLNQEDLFSNIARRIEIIPYAVKLFVVGQLLFGIYFIRVINSKTKST